MDKKYTDVPLIVDAHGGEVWVKPECFDPTSGVSTSSINGGCCIARFFGPDAVANAQLTACAPDLLAAAAAVIERWETPLWKDAPATAEYINALRAMVAKSNAELNGAAQQRPL